MRRYGIDARPLYSEVSGIPTYIKRLIEGLSGAMADDEELLLYLPTPICPYSRNWGRWRRIRQDCFKLRSVSFDGSGFMLWLHALLETRSKLKIMPVDSILKDICIYHNTNYEELRCKRAKKIITIYDLAAIKFPELHSKKQLERARDYKSMCEAADAIICISNATQRDVIEMLGIRENKTSVIHLAPAQCDMRDYSSDEISAVKKKYGVSDKYIIYVGTVEPRKNLVNLIKAYNKLVHSGGAEHNLVLAGRMGWLYDGILREAYTSPYNNKIKILGQIEGVDIGPLLAGADLFVYPSIMEGFGLPVLEAFACKVPVLTSNTSSLPEVAGDAAITVNPYDVGEISEGMKRILEDSTLSTALRIGGVKRLEHFSWERCAIETLSVYRSISMH